VQNFIQRSKMTSTPARNGVDWPGLEDVLYNNQNTQLMGKIQETNMNECPFIRGRFPSFNDSPFDNKETL